MEAQSSNYEIVRVPLPGKEAEVYQLASSSSRTPLAEFAKKRQNHEAADMLLTALESIAENGIEASLAIGRTLRRLKGPVVEVKVPGAVVRAISYNEAGNDALVVLDVFRGHQGSGNVHREIGEAEKKSAIVRDLLRRKDEV